MKLASSIDYTTDPLVVLAMWQPWAILAVAPDPAHDGKPAKVHETRHWLPRFERPFGVAIHATKTINADVIAAFETCQFRAALRRCGYCPHDPRAVRRFPDLFTELRRVPFGAIIGLAVVECCDQMERICVGELYGNPAHDDDHEFGWWKSGRYAWRLARTVLLPEPVPHKGRQDALYAVDAETRANINAQLLALPVAP